MQTRISTSGSRRKRGRVVSFVPEVGMARLLLIYLCGLAVSIGITAQSEDESALAPNLAHDISYNNYRKPAGPWSIHVVRVPRQSAQFRLCAMHATGKAVGLTPVTDQRTRADDLVAIGRKRQKGGNSELILMPRT